MKRKILSFLVMFAIVSGSCFAKSASSEPALWGIKANFGLELPGNWRGNGNSVKMYSTGVDAQVGAVCNIYLGRDFYFEPGAALFYESYKFDNLGILGAEGDVVATDPGIHKLGVRVPLVFGYTFALSEDFSMCVFTGPQIGYALWGEVSTEYPSNYYGDEFPTDLFGKHGHRRFEFGWKIGVGIPFNNFMVSFEGDLGITDLLKNGMSFRENRCIVGLTYYF